MLLFENADSVVDIYLAFVFTICRDFTTSLSLNWCCGCSVNNSCVVWRLEALRPFPIEVVLSSFFVFF